MSLRQYCNLIQICRNDNDKTELSYGLEKRNAYFRLKNHWPRKAGPVTDYQEYITANAIVS